MRKPVLCEIDERGDIVRIFKFRKKAYQYPVESIQEFPYAFAVEMIRKKVFARAGCTRVQSGNCEWCGATIIWESNRPLSGHMHEKVARGKMTFENTDNEYSIDNSVAICSNCHIGPNGAHSNRSWHTAKVKGT
jgi:5-methylcytosine-specific restriction endonuclease McrA